MDRQDQQKTRVDGIHTLHPDIVWPTQQNAGQIHHHKCLSTTKENLQLPSTCRGRKIYSYLPPVVDVLGLKMLGLYSISCGCGQV